MRNENEFLFFLIVGFILITPPLIGIIFGMKTKEPLLFFLLLGVGALLIIVGLIRENKSKRIK